jgi:DnaK suppressor protein
MATLSTYWSPSDLQILRQSLVDQHRFLLDEHSAAQQLRDADQRTGTDVAGDSTTKKAVNAQFTRLDGELVAVEGALKRLYRGVFGVCVDCRQDISASRLRAQPAAEYCLSCQRAREADPAF